jgi:hypothetical protein
MGELEHSLITGLLLAVLFIVLSLSVFAVSLVRRLRKREGPQAPSEPSPESNTWTRVFSMPRHATLRRPDCWLAVRSRNVHAVQSALALQDVRPCFWADSLAGVADQKLFISPPVSGWVLVMGSALPNPCDDEDAAYRFLLPLSRKLGHVQLFSVSGVFNQHAWVQVEMGRVLRAYAWSGKTLWNQGERTSAEKELDLKCYDYAQPSANTPFGYRDPSCGNSDKVHLLAARWSIDPDEIDDQFIEHALGIVGEPARIF